MIGKTSDKHRAIRGSIVSHHRNQGCVSPASASTSGVFVKSLAAKRTLEDHAMLHFRMSIWDQISGQCDAALRAYLWVLSLKVKWIPRGNGLLLSEGSLQPDHKETLSHQWVGAVDVDSGGLVNWYVCTRVCMFVYMYDSYYECMYV